MTIYNEGDRVELRSLRGVAGEVTSEPDVLGCLAVLWDGASEPQSVHVSEVRREPTVETRTRYVALFRDGRDGFEEWFITGYQDGYPTRDEAYEALVKERDGAAAFAEKYRNPSHLVADFRVVKRTETITEEDA